MTLIGLISAGAAASGSAQEPSSDPDIETNKEIVRQFIEVAWEQGDLALLDDLVSPNGIGNVAGLPQAPGPKGYKQLIATFRQAFPDLGYEVHSLIASATTWSSSGPCTEPSWANSKDWPRPADPSTSRESASSGSRTATSSTTTPSSTP